MVGDSGCQGGEKRLRKGRGQTDGAGAAARLFLMGSAIVGSSQQTLRCGCRPNGMKRSTGLLGRRDVRVGSGWSCSWVGASCRLQSSLTVGVKVQRSPFQSVSRPALACQPIRAGAMSVCLRPQLWPQSQRHVSHMSTIPASSYINHSHTLDHSACKSWISSASAQRPPMV